MYHADDVVDVGARERKPRVRGLSDDREVLLERVGERHIRDVRPRDHDVARRPLGIVDDVLEELSLLPRERPDAV